MEGPRSALNPPLGAPPHTFPPENIPLSRTALQGSMSPKSVLQGGADLPQLLPPRVVENPLKAALSDRTSGALLLDAVTSDCGHTYGSASLQKVMSLGTCIACGTPVDPGRLVPNLAVRAAAFAFQAEEGLDASLRKRGREGEGSRGALPYIRETEQKAYVFPYKLHDRVRVKGNKRTPPHFVGKEAIIVHEGLNGWYTVRLKEGGEETRLQYRSLEALTDEKASKKEESGCKEGVEDSEGAKKRKIEKEVVQTGGVVVVAQREGLLATQLATPLAESLVKSGADKREEEGAGGGVLEQTVEVGKAPPLVIAGEAVVIPAKMHEVARLRGGAPSADSPRASPSPKPWGSAASDVNHEVSVTNFRPSSAAQKRTNHRKPVINPGGLARGGSSSGSERGEEDEIFEARGDATNAGASDEEDLHEGGAALTEEVRSKPQKLLSVPERDRCVKSNGRGWRCKLRKAPGYQYCEHHQRNWDGHEKQWKKAFPETGDKLESEPPVNRVKTKVKKIRINDGVSGPNKKKVKKATPFLGDQDEFEIAVHKKAKSLAAKRLEKALKSARGAGGAKLYKKVAKPGLAFPFGDDYEYDSDEFDIAQEFDPQFLSQKRIEKAQKYKTLVANKEYIEDDRGNLKVLEVQGGAEPSEQELLAQVERVCPEIDLEHLSSVDITATVAMIAAMGREEAEILLGSLLMRHSSKELEQVQGVIDQEKQIVLAKLEALNRRDVAKMQWKKRPFLGFGEGGPPRKKRSTNLVKTGRVPRLFSILFMESPRNGVEVTKSEVTHVKVEIEVKCELRETEACKAAEGEVKDLVTEVVKERFQDTGAEPRSAAEIGVNKAPVMLNQAQIEEVRQSKTEAQHLPVSLQTGGQNAEGFREGAKGAISFGGSDSLHIQGVIAGSNLAGGAELGILGGRVHFTTGKGNPPSPNNSVGNRVSEGLQPCQQTNHDKKIEIRRDTSGAAPPVVSLGAVDLRPVAEREPLDADDSLRSASQSQSREASAKVDDLFCVEEPSFVSRPPSAKLTARQEASPRFLGAHRVDPVMRADDFDLGLDLLNELDAFGPLMDRQGDETDNSDSD